MRNGKGGHMKLKDIAALNTLKAQSLALLENRRVSNPITTLDAKGKPRHIMVCGGTGCHASDSPEIAKLLKEELDQRGMTDQVEVLQTGCFGFCEKGPILEIHPDNVLYVDVSATDVKNNLSEGCSHRDFY